MSRSRKKNPIVKDGGHYNKKLHSRRFRRRNKMILLSCFDYEFLFFKLQNQLTNQYDICDHIYYDLDKYYKGDQSYKAWMK